MGKDTREQVQDLTLPSKCSFSFPISSEISLAVAVQSLRLESTLEVKTALVHPERLYPALAVCGLLRGMPLIEMSLAQSLGSV